ncbi:hypothetical protein Poli38472_011716 [Pythium oligandrum]|uniref:STAS domain-containing protein n=1 Tax=Pythium oligandrum TaxID=41045 RepID=A0A8K1C821_PYTOL|nr:hypothetical protein Poli38472_011716 [Pythium oligandrum]|eukprot:TMW58128.1 hypothetical protein Poli38472_011716 [Pythium oligandrum]
MTAMEGENGRSASLRALRVSNVSYHDESYVSHGLTPRATGVQEEIDLASRLYVQLEPADRDHSVKELLHTTVVNGWQRFARAVRSAGMSSTSKRDAMRAVPTQFSKACKSTVGYYRLNLGILRREVLCGVAATLLMIPETVAFSYVANLDPIVGLYATGFFGIVVGLFGGVPGTVAGAAGALAVVMPTLTGSDGSLSHLTYEERIQHLFVAVFIAGLFQLAFGILELSRFFSMIPRTAHIGFLNGLAIMMFLSQKTTFEDCTRDDLRFGECEKQGHLTWMSASNPVTWTTLFTVILTMVIMVYFPRVPLIGRLIPPTLVVAIVGIGFEFGINRPLLGWDVRTIGDTSPLSGSFPSIHPPSLGSIKDWGSVLSCAASLAMVGIFESIMTIQAVVDLTKGQLTRTACRKECIAQGIGNLLCGFFQGMGGCSMIGQSTGNVLNGARHRLSSVCAGIFTFMVILFASPAIELVPVACLTGILIVIIAHTFYWPTFGLLFRIKLTEAFTIVLVTVLAAMINLAVAVIAGVIWQCVVHGWTSGRQIRSTSTTETVDATIVTLEHDDDGESGATTQHSTVEARVYLVHGTLLYSSVVHFREFFDVVNDPSVVIVDLQHCHVADFSAVAALKEAAMRYRDHGKTLLVRHLDSHGVDLVVHHDLAWELTDDVYLRQKPVPPAPKSPPPSPFSRIPAIVSPVPLQSPISSYHKLHE